MNDNNNRSTMKPPLSPPPQKPADGAKAAPPLAPAPGLKIRASLRGGYRTPAREMDNSN